MTNNKNKPENQWFKIGLYGIERRFEDILDDLENEQAQKLKDLEDKLKQQNKELEDNLERLPTPLDWSTISVANSPALIHLAHHIEQTKQDINALEKRMQSTETDRAEWKLPSQIMMGFQRQVIDDPQEPTRMQKRPRIGLYKDDEEENSRIYTQWLKAPTMTNPLDTLIGQVNQHLHDQWGPYLGGGPSVTLRLTDAVLSVFGRTRRTGELDQLVKLLDIILRYKQCPENAANLEHTQQLMSALEAGIKPPEAQASESPSPVRQFIDNFQELSGLRTVNPGGMGVGMFTAPQDKQGREDVCLRQIKKEN